MRFRLSPHAKIVSRYNFWHADCDLSALRPRPSSAGDRDRRSAALRSRLAREVSGVRRGARSAARSRGVGAAPYWGHAPSLPLPSVTVAEPSAWRAGRESAIRSPERDRATPASGLQAPTPRRPSSDATRHSAGSTSLRRLPTWTALSAPPSISLRTVRGETRRISATSSSTRSGSTGGTGRSWTATA